MPRDPPTPLVVHTAHACWAFHHILTAQRHAGSHHSGLAVNAGYLAPPIPTPTVDEEDPVIKPGSGTIEKSYDEPRDDEERRRP
jgi:hypothetical protein